MKDLIDFVKEPSAIITVNGSPFTLTMLEGDTLIFSDGERELSLTEKSLRVSTYHGGGEWKVKRKLNSQVVGTYRMSVQVNGQKKEIKNEKDQQPSG